MAAPARSVLTALRTVISRHCELPESIVSAQPPGVSRIRYVRAGSAVEGVGSSRRRAGSAGSPTAEPDA